MWSGSDLHFLPGVLAAFDRITDGKYSSIINPWNFEIFHITYLQDNSLATLVSHQEMRLCDKPGEGATIKHGDRVNENAALSVFI